MTRSISNDFNTALSQQIVKPVFLFKAIFNEVNYYWTSLSWDINWDSQLWLGNGFLLDFQTPNETQDLNYSGMEIQLPGNLSALISILLNNSKTSNQGFLYFGLLGSDNILILNPYLLFKGFLNGNKISQDKSTARLVLSYENELNLFLADL